MATQAAPLGILEPSWAFLPMCASAARCARAFCLLRETMQMKTMQMNYEETRSRAELAN